MEVTKVRTVWMCLADDGGGAGILTLLKQVTPARQLALGLPRAMLGTYISVPCVAYTPEIFKAIVAEARQQATTFRCVRFEFAEDETAQW